MKQQVETWHHLEVSTRGQCFTRVSSLQPLYSELHDADVLARNGRLEEALDTAEEAWIAKHGHMHGVHFRCVTKTDIITIRAGSFDPLKQDQ